MRNNPKHLFFVFALLLGRLPVVSMAPFLVPMLDFETRGKCRKECKPLLL